MHIFLCIFNEIKILTCIFNQKVGFHCEILIYLAIQKFKNSAFISFYPFATDLSQQATVRNYKLIKTADVNRRHKTSEIINDIHKAHPERICKKPFSHRINI